jgi:hypothetical protein
LVEAKPQQPVVVFKNNRKQKIEQISKQEVYYFYPDVSTIYRDAFNLCVLRLNYFVKYYRILL